MADDSDDDDLRDKCPQCGRMTVTDGPGGGEVCEAKDCDYWFCY